MCCADALSALKFVVELAIQPKKLAVRLEDSSLANTMHVARRPVSQDLPSTSMMMTSTPAASLQAPRSHVPP